MRLPPYPKYKPSGVEWLGDVPEHWGAEPLKYSTDFINGMAFKPESWSTEGVPIIRIENLNGGLDFNCFESDVPARYHVSQGDLLFGWSGNRGTSFGPFLWCRDGLHYLNQHIFKLTAFTCDKSWFYWCLKAVTRTIEDEAHGIIGMVHVTRGRLGAVPIPRVTPEEQRAIADFLDRETAKIDALVAKKRTLIERLKEKRTALISRTVTRGLPPEAARATGLDPHPKLKPSGIDWLGDVPEHWEQKQLKWAVTFQRGHDLPADEREDGAVPLVSSAGVSASHSRAIAKGPGIVTGRYGTIGQFYLVDDDYWPLNTTLYGINLRGNEPHFLQAMLTHLAPLFLLNAVKSAVPGVDRNDIHPVITVIPPVPEQKAIADFLDLEKSKIDRMVAKVEAAIARLQEYRTALITAAVTGKIDVRGAVA
jgi:type I restriction enzyme, S subunit